MQRIAVTFFLAIVYASSASAHFLFILTPKEGKTASIVFSDHPKTDDKIEVTKLELRSAQLRNSSGKMTTITPETELGGWRVTLANDTAEVRATLEYGVVNRGEGHLIRIRHHARMVVAEVTDAKPAATFDITPVKGSAGVALRVTFDGKPVAATDVTLYDPVSNVLRVVKTDRDGMTTPIPQPGTYSVRALHIDKTPGEFEGRKYAVTHSYATLTFVAK